MSYPIFPKSLFASQIFARNQWSSTFHAKRAKSSMSVFTVTNESCIFQMNRPTLNASFWQQSVYEAHDPQAKHGDQSFT